MKRHSESEMNNHITYNQDIVRSEVRNLTYDFKFINDLVKPLQEENNILKTTIHDLNFKVENKVDMNFSEQQQFSSEPYYMGIIKEKKEGQIQGQLGQQQKISQKDYELQQQLFNQKNQEILYLKTQHEVQCLKIINESEKKLQDIKLVNQNLQLQIKDDENKIQYQDNNVEKVIECRMLDKLKEMVKLNQEIEDLKEEIVNAENLHQAVIDSMKLQNEKDKKHLQDELEKQQYKIETKYMRAYQQNSFNEDQIVDLQKSNKSLKVEIDTYETQINQLKSQKMIINQDSNKEKRERAIDNQQIKENELLLIKFKDNENRLNRLAKRLEKQILKNQKEYELTLHIKKVKIQEQNDHFQQQQHFICQIQQSIINQKAGYEEQLMIQKIKFHKQLGLPIDETNLQFLTHDFEQEYDDPVNISNLEKNQVNQQSKLQSCYDQIRQLKQEMAIQKEEQSNRHQLELENYKQIIQKNQQALKTQQDEAITQIFGQYNLKLQNLADQHEYEIKQIQESHLLTEQRLSEANQDMISKLKEMEEVKLNSAQRQYRLQQEIKQLEDKSEKQSSDYEKQKLQTIQENQKLNHNLQLQIEENLNQISQLENEIDKLTSQQQANLHEIQELKQQIINSKKELELEDQENQIQQDHIKKLQEGLRLLQLEVDNSKIIYNIFRQKSHTDIFQTHHIRSHQSEQIIRYKLQQINKSIPQKYHRIYKS